MSEFAIVSLFFSLMFIGIAFLMSFPVAAYKSSKFYIIMPHRAMTTSEEAWVEGCKFWQRAQMVMAFIFTLCAFLPNFIQQMNTWKFPFPFFPLMIMVIITHLLFKKHMEKRFDENGRRRLN